MRRRKTRTTRAPAHRTTPQACIKACFSDRLLARTHQVDRLRLVATPIKYFRKYFRKYFPKGLRSFVPLSRYEEKARCERREGRAERGRRSACECSCCD